MTPIEKFISISIALRNFLIKTLFRWRLLIWEHGISETQIFINKLSFGSLLIRFPFFEYQTKYQVLQLNCTVLMSFLGKESEN